MDQRSDNSSHEQEPRDAEETGLPEEIQESSPAEGTQEEGRAEEDLEVKIAEPPHESRPDTRSLFQIRLLENKLADYEKRTGEIRDYVKKMESEIVQIKARSAREAERIVQQKLSEFLLQLLKVVDSFELGLKSAKDEKSSVAEGIRLIHQQFQDFLNANDLTRIPTVGHDFDPNLHEAVVSCKASSDAEDGKVVEEFKAGYKYKDNVLRPAQVVVAQA